MNVTLEHVIGALRAATAFLENLTGPSLPDTQQQDSPGVVHQEYVPPGTNAPAVSVPQTEPVQVQTAAVGVEYSLGDVQTFVGSVASQLSPEQQQQLGQIIANYGVQRISEIDPSQYGTLIQTIKGTFNL